MSGPDLKLQDPRANEVGICGVIEHTERVEWICVRPEHGDTRDGAVPLSGHYMVNRWPNRPIGETRT